MSSKKRTLKEWESLASKELGERTVDSLTSDTPEGIQVKPLYTSMDLDQSETIDGLPGIEPYVRGPRATMYANRPWTIRQYAGFSSAKESNAFYRQNLAAGQKGLSVAFDLPTHRGYDSDHPRVVGDVGKAGVIIDSVEDMKILFDRIPLDQMSVSMTMNGAVLPIMAAYIVAAEEQGVKPKALTGTIQNDILKEYLTRNTYIFSPEPSMRITADVIDYCSKNMPRFNSISISGYHMMEAGADCALQAAFTLANGLEYVKAALARGLDIDQFAPRLSFFFGIGMDFFMYIAMLRAARFLWAEIMAQFNPKNPKSKMLRTHCQTSGWSLTQQDPYNNIVRTTLESLSAILGGTQSLHTNSFDEALGLPTELSARISRNTQILAQEETRICNVIDPLGGSYYVETLTQNIIDKVRLVLKEIESQGGMVRAIETGMAKLKIEAVAAKRQARIDKGEDVIVGLNKYQVEEKESIPVREISDAVRKEHIQSLKQLRKNRDKQKVKTCLEQITHACRTNKNLLAACLPAVRARATVGEITHAMEKVYSRFVATSKTVTGVYASERSDSDMIDSLIERTRTFEKKIGRRPRVLLCKIGQDGHDRGVKVIAAAFADFGFDVDLGPMFQTPEEAAKMAVENDVHVLAISSLAAGHTTLVPQVIQELKKQGASDMKIVLGGIIPSQDFAFLKKAGVHAIFGPGTDVGKAADTTLKLLGA